MLKNRSLKGFIVCFILILLLLPTGYSFASSNTAVISTLAGEGIIGKLDGEKEQAQFQLPSFATVDQEGTIYISDTGNHLIRKMTWNGTVTTIAGQTGAKDDYGQFIGGYEDGDAENARFHDPKGLAISSDGLIYIADAENGMIRTLDPSTNQVATFATDLNHPSDLVVDEFDRLYISESLAHRIVKITQDGTRDVVAGGGYEEEDGWLVGEFKDGIGEQAQFNEPSGLALAEDGTLYIADTGNQRIRTLTPDGQVSTLAGSYIEQIEFTSYVQGGDVDGEAHQARFNFPTGLALAEDGTLYVADTLNHRIRQISSAGYVSTVAGDARHGYEDGIGLKATFNQPSDLLMLTDGRLVVVDQWNHSLRIVEWEQEPFTDINDQWGATYILELVSHGLVDGYPDGTFKPDQSMTRAEFTKVLIQALDQELEGSSLFFADREDIPTWVEKEVSIATELGMIQGYGDQTFRPSEPITRAEMATIIARAMQIEASDDRTTSFIDDQDIPTWAKGAVKVVQDRGMIEGRSGNKFIPNETATRAEVATIILQMIKR